MTAADSRAFGKEDRSAAFYAFCHRYAQSKWMSGLPAQALLQLNRALSADLRGGEPELETQPLPYAVVTWILRARPDRRGQFLANPRRHYQHYATRMSGPRSELRASRAWACFHLCEGVLPEDEFPRDAEQIEGEGIAVPEVGEVLSKLERLGLPGEGELVRALLEGNR
jgi:hypothetical protein